jgi:hypothetical protein
MAKHSFSISKKNLGFAILVGMFMQFVLPRIPIINSVPWSSIALLVYLLVAIYLLFF